MLFLVGTLNKRRIREGKRTQSFTPKDFDLLVRLIRCFGKLIATPHVLRYEVRWLFKALVEQIQESYDASRILVADPLFERLGLTDAAIATVCSRGILVLTSDVELQLAVQRRGADALNFNHVRPLTWN